MERYEVDDDAMQREDGKGRKGGRVTSHPDVNCRHYCKINVKMVVVENWRSGRGVARWW